MKQVKRTLAMLLCMAMVLSLCMVYAVAGNVCSEADIKGDANTTVTFYITTKDKWKLSKDSIKLTATKGSLVYGTWSGGEKSDSTYGCYHVNVYKKSGGSWIKVKKSSFEWKNEESPKIKKLERSTDYKIVIEPYSIEEIGDTHKIRYSCSNLGGCSDLYWDSVPTWTISSTSKGIMTCSK